MALTDIQWLRKLVEDEPVEESEISTADGVESDFFVSNPPISVGTEAVKVNGAATTAYTVVQQRAVSFVSPPPANAQVLIRYTRQTFTDDELDHYLGIAGGEWTSQAGRVYRAAVYAIDSLMAGAATALDFGAGAESFSMTSVWARLQQLRQMYVASLESLEVSEAGGFQLVDVVVDDGWPY